MRIFFLKLSSKRDIFMNVLHQSNFVTQRLQFTQKSIFIIIPLQKFQVPITSCFFIKIQVMSFLPQNKPLCLRHWFLGSIIIFFYFIWASVCFGFGFSFSWVEEPFCFFFGFLTLVSCFSSTSFASLALIFAVFLDVAWLVAVDADFSYSLLVDLYLSTHHWQKLRNRNRNKWLAKFWQPF